MARLERDLVIVGAGMAGTRLAQHLVEMGYAGKISLIGEEPDAGYNRILLSPVLSGEKQFESTLLAAQSWYSDSGVELITGTKVSSVDLEASELALSTEDTMSYKVLVFATGSNPFIIPFEGHTAEGVYAFRTKADVERMLDRAKRGTGKVAVIGGGLLGLEAASALARRGAKPTVVHNADYLLQLQLNQPAAKIIESHLGGMGVEFRLGALTKKIGTTDGQVSSLEFENQPPLEVDTVIMATGVRPNISLAAEAGLEVGRAIQVDACMRTSHPNVFAVGECVEFENVLFGMVAPVYDQARVLAKLLCGKEEKFVSKPLATKLKVTGVDLFSAGCIENKDEYQICEYQDPVGQVYRRLSFLDGKLVGAILVGDVADGGFLFEHIQAQTDLSQIRNQIVYGQHYCDTEGAA